MRRLCRALFKGQEIARLTVKHFAEPLQRAKANGPGPASLEDGQILRSDPHQFSQRVQPHLPPGEHHVHIDDNRHGCSFPSVQMVSSFSSRKSTAMSINHAITIMTVPITSESAWPWNVVARCAERASDEQGHSEGLTAYLTAMGRFHNYSFGNILEIARQKPDATRVAGLYAWNQLKRRVRKGEHGIRILAPVIGIKRKKDEEAEKDIRIQNHAVLVGFRSAYVFDVSQTDGEELPELSTKVSGDVGERRERLIDFIVAQGIQLEFKESIAPALGASYGGKIVLLPGQSTAEEFSTLVHELSHEMLHRAERRTVTTKIVRETEAEAIAFVVGKTIGLDTGRVSADYIHLYHGNAALLAESLEVIQRTSAVILSALETPTAEAEAAQEAEPELAKAS